MAYQPKSYRKFLAGTVTAAVVASAVAPAASAAFSDVSANDTHAINVNKAVEMGLINGYPDGTFGTYQDITRGQVAKIIARYLGNVDTTGTEQFTDVANSPDTELKAAALKVRAAGVFTGSNGALNAGKNITRQEMATVVARLFELTDLEDVESKVTDNDSAWEVHRANINLLSEHGITTESTFNPLGNVKRGQFASFFVRAIEKTQEVKIEKVTALDASGKFVEINFSAPVVGLEASDIQITDAKTGARKGVKEVTLSSNGKLATVELFAPEDASSGEVLAYLTDYTIKVYVNGETLTATFNRPAFVNNRVVDVDAKEREITVERYVFDDEKDANVRSDAKISIPTDVEFDFYNALAREVRVWYNQDGDLVNIAFEDEDVFETGLEVTTARTYDKDGNLEEAGEIKLLDSEEKYDLADSFQLYVNGKSVSAGDLKAKNQEYDFAKVVFDKSGDVEALFTYELSSNLLVESTEDNMVFGYDSNEVNVKDYLIVKEGKQVSVEDLEDGDLLFYNDDAEEDGFAIVVDNKVTGEIEGIFDDSFDVAGENYEYAGVKYLDADGEFTTLTDDDAEKLQAGGEVTLHLDAKGDLVYVTGNVENIATTSNSLYLQGNPLAYLNNKLDGSLELEGVNAEGDAKLYDFALKSLDQITVYDSGATKATEKEYEVDEAFPGNSNQEIDEFKFAKVVEAEKDADYEIDGKYYALAKTNDDAKVILAVNDVKAGETGAYAEVVISLDALLTDIFTLDAEKNVKAPQNIINVLEDADGNVHTLEFFNSYKALSESFDENDKYADGYRLQDETVIYDLANVDAKDLKDPDEDDVTVTTWGELKEAGVDILKNNAVIYYDEDGYVTHIVTYTKTITEDTKHIALIQEVATRDNKVTRITALIDGKSVQLDVDKESADFVKKGAVVELSLNKAGDLVTGFTDLSNGRILAGKVKDINVSDREITLEDDTVVELSKDGDVYKATDKDSKNYKDQSLSEIKKGEYVVIALPSAGSKFADAVVEVTSSTAGDVNSAPTTSDIKDTTATTGTPLAITLADYFNDADKDVLTYTASSSTEAIATVEASATTLTVTPVKAGTTTITVTAKDGKGGIVTDTFDVTVSEADVEITKVNYTAQNGLQEGNANVAPGATVGSLSVDGGNAPVSYALATGDNTNDADNDKFVIEGSSVKVATGVTLTEGTYAVYVEATDADGDKAQLAITITVAAKAA